MLETTDESRELAAQVWCKPETSNIEMDVRLAQAFAEILDQKGHEIVKLELENAKLQERVEELESSSLKTDCDHPGVTHRDGRDYCSECGEIK